MSSEDIQRVRVVVLQGNDLFLKCHEQSVTPVGFVGGSGYDMVHVDCESSGRRLIFMVKDSLQGEVGIGVGPKGGSDAEFNFIGQFPLDSLTPARVFELMETHFLSKPA